jgi:clan AA aspartic protease (TIGR02281 family)
MIRLFLFFPLFILSNYSYSQLKYNDIENINLLSKKKDFNAVINFLKYKGYVIESFNENVDYNDYVIIAEIKANLKSLEDDKFYNKDNIQIQFLEYNDEYKVEIRSHKYYYKPYISSDFLSIKRDALRSWGSLGWTQVLIQNPSLWEKNNKSTFDSIPIILRNIDQDTSNSMKSLTKSFILGWPNEIIQFGESSFYPNYELKKIKLSDYYFDFFNDRNLNKVTARNLNPDFGEIMYYSLDFDSKKFKERDNDINKIISNVYDSILFYQSNLNINLNSIILKNKNEDKDKFVEIPLLQRGKTYYVKIKVGDRDYIYVVDSGASATSINQESVYYLEKNNTLNIQNRLSDSKYQLADGTIVIMKRVVIPEFKISNLVIKDIEATIVQNNKPLLLGKSFFDKFKSWKIDNKNNKLILERF